MSREAAEITTANDKDVVVKKRDRSKFFQIMAGVLLLILLLGFGPTLYIRAAFDVPAIPFYLHLHGAVVTCWFLFFLVQTSLVANRRTDIHRRTGLAGAVLALAVVFAGPMATMGFVGRLPAMGFDVETHIFFVSWVVLANIASILAFAIFVLAGILLRHRPEVHKRLMLLATLCIIGPPLARIANWPVFSWIEEIPFVIAGSLILLATLAIYDFVANRRLHTVTLAGGLFSVLIILAPPVIANAGFAHSFVRGMG